MFPGLILFLAAFPGLTPRAFADDANPIKIFQPKRLTGKPFPVTRMPLGIPEDYKPWLIRLLNGELILVAFHAGRNPVREYAVFWRSKDGGKTWSKRKPRKDIAGREFAATMLSDGTILITCHFLKQDSQNKAGYTYSKVFRSTDNGKSWTELRVGPEGFPKRASTNTDRNAFEIPDPKRPGKTLTCLGVSISGARRDSAKYAYLWRSSDFGKTWDKSLRVETGGWDDCDGFFGQSSTYRTQSGRLLHVVRVDARGKYWKIPGLKLKKQAGDQGDRMMIWQSDDGGRNWKQAGMKGNFGTYGEMYPRFLRLKDRRLLLTFTVRSNSTDTHPLGLRAIVSYDDGKTWDFRRDRLILEHKNNGPSGGGYGNTVQNEDGTLVSCYSYRGADRKTHVEAVRWRIR